MPPAHILVLLTITLGIPATAALNPARQSFQGSKPGDERKVFGVKLCWCPAGKFTMGSPRGEPERRPGEDQVEVTLTKGFWAGKYEVTQGLWKRVIGKLPGALTAELPEGDDFPVGNVNFAETEAFCQKLTELGARQATCPKPGSSGFRPKRSGNTPAGQAPRPRHPSGISSAASRQTSAASPTTGPKRVRRSKWPPRSACIRVTPGGCTTCTAIPTNGAATGTTRSCPAVSTPTCTPHSPRQHRTEPATPRECAGEVAGPTTAGPAGRPAASGLSQNGGMITSDFASWPSSGHAD